MKLKDLLRGLPDVQLHADPETELSGVSYDSRMTQPGDLFVALQGYAADGNSFIAAALEKGARCVLCDETPSMEIPYVRVPSARRALAVASANFFDQPAREMTMVGVTGTNGKTTTTYLIKSILEQKAGAKVGLIGTNQNMIGSQMLHTERTTPESYEVQKLLRQMADAGCSHVVMEVSSHALVLDRVYGISYAVGIFTNLTQDHLDFHKTMEAYCDAKAILFQNCGVGIYNADDPWSERLMENATCRKFSYGIHHKADLSAKEITLGDDHVAFTAEADTEWARFRVSIPGGFTVYNTLDAVAACWNLGVPLGDCAEALVRTPGVKGRVEVLPTPGRDFTILADYAHTPDALENVLSAVKGFARGRTVAVFGCGGDRDRTKRPLMGAIAAQIADFVVVTSDNPRTEEPGAIIDEILEGMRDTKTPYVVVENRVEAIHYAIDHAQKDDVIVLCGKGHEDYQVIGTEKHHLDEREVVARYLKA
ncbi:MAG: UDP-N-acetylmuramoyl-L-alanyl-D-glutamate--2,6-diaminopimelate ligase [Clostridiales bacterium]|nr:UDP-N-acetylmuramoyl-L-alanyl-D-glutamate--2,6-diaminopimelate ligase [Clostridiales bacterium]